MKAYLSLGSNLGDRLANLERALELLDGGGCKIVRRSSVYETAPRYYLEQPVFFNMAVACETELSPWELLVLIGRTEAALRRRRLVRNGPRTIDVDILFYGGRVIDEQALAVPHPRLAEREFVLAPLAEIAPGLRHPVTGLTVPKMLSALRARGGVRCLPSDYAELEEWLRALPPPAVDRHYSLKPVKAALARLGYPQERMGTVVHITGSTGKTSSACMTAAALSANGWRTGLYTSPHVRSLRERIQVNGREISEKDLLDCFLRVESVAAGELSFFETMTAAAFLYFSLKKTDFSVVEAGLGGRLDATNSAPGTVAGITSVSLEHAALLGPRLSDIAAHKAGIIKKGAAVLVGQEVPEQAWRVIRAAASSAGARVYRPLVCVLPDLGNCGAFQLPNGAFALRAASLAAEKAGLKLDLALAERALRRSIPPGRFQRLRLAGRTIIVDGAHNAEGVAALTREFSERPASVCVASFMSDKDAAPLVRALAALSEKLILTRSLSYRAADPEALRRHLPPERREKTLVVENPVAALQRALKLAPHGGTVLVAGSLYLAGDVLAWFNGGRAFHPPEMLVKS